MVWGGSVHVEKTRDLIVYPRSVGAVLTRECREEVVLSGSVCGDCAALVAS